ncbi:MAG: hypothetical protein P4L33_02500 [Capsulimonadaceae bacterium]|nr:hypothetical protein [Capsulimonadaceae bacterium]
MLHDILTNEWVHLAIRTLAITFASRIVLDLATSPVVSDDHTGVFWSALLGWSVAVLLAAWAFGSALGVVAALVACVAHTAGVMRRREDALIDD